MEEESLELTNDQEHNEEQSIQSVLPVCRQGYWNTNTQFQFSVISIQLIFVHCKNEIWKAMFKTNWFGLLKYINSTHLSGILPFQYHVPEQFHLHLFSTILKFPLYPLYWKNKMCLWNAMPWPGCSVPQEQSHNVTSWKHLTYGICNIKC